MNGISKSVLSVDGNNVRVSMPFAKVDEKNRLVSGWATLDNVDTQGDVVLADASAKAFSRARGNIREMHQPLAVGRMVDFREDEYFDKRDNKLYRGIYVTARVSEGAEDTWKKVLDGTLAGFSIGGEVKQASNDFNKDAGRTVRFIEDYDLTELSLVDNPANQLANIESFQKSVFSIKHNDAGETVLKGMVAETSLENVFICENKESHEEEMIVVKAEESTTCPTCGNGMANIGWFESSDDRAEKVNNIVTKFLHTDDTEVAPSSEGGVDMSKKVTEPVASEEVVSESTEEVPAEEAVDVEEITEEVEETVEEISPDEVTDEVSEVSKKIDELHEVFKSSIAEANEETIAKVSELEVKIEDAKSEFLAKASEIEEKINGFGEQVQVHKQRLAELENSLEKVNNAGAFKKSADVASAAPVVQKERFWGGAFSDQ